MNQRRKISTFTIVIVIIKTHYVANHWRKYYKTANIYDNFIVGLMQEGRNCILDIFQ